MRDGGECMSVEALFREKKLVKICAPMVRYSRLPFRTLVRKYDCDLAFTPMFMADSFVKSDKCRKAEFTTNSGDFPLIVQFASKSAEEMAAAAEIVYRDSNGVDLNVGCPQRWAVQEGIGACMLKKPELIYDILNQTRNRIPDSSFSVSTKIRILPDIVSTVEVARRLEMAGISFLSVHGRTIVERKEPVHLDVIKIIAESVNIPVIANGSIFSLEEAQAVQKHTGSRGVMCARGILENPAMFTGCTKTPVSCIQDWLDINAQMGSHFTMFRRHLIAMCEGILTKSERRTFNLLNNMGDVCNYLEQKFNIVTPKLMQMSITDDE